MASAELSKLNLRKRLCADFCQGDECYSNFSRGRQCVTNCISFLMKSFLKKIDDFDTQDMNFVLITGDTLYQKLCSEGESHDLLHFSDIPKFILFQSFCFTVYGKKSYVGTMCREGGIDGVGLSLESSLNLVSSLARQEVSLLLTFHSAAIAIKYYKTTGAFYVFDSHSRGMDGICLPNGTAVLSVFYSLEDICVFLGKLCVPLSATIPLEAVQYELCLFDINYGKRRKRGAIDLDRDLDLQYHFVNLVERGNENTICNESTTNTPETKYQCLQIMISGSSRTLLDGTSPPFAQINDNDSHYNCSTSSPDNKFARKIESFHKKVARGPVYQCSCCTQTWFQESVRNANNLHNSLFANKCLTRLKSVDDIEWVCNTCYNSIKACKVPALAVVNGMGFPPKPPELLITELEERLISPRIPFMQLV